MQRKLQNDLNGSASKPLHWTPASFPCIIWQRHSVDHFCYALDLFSKSPKKILLEDVETCNSEQHKSVREETSCNSICDAVNESCIMCLHTVYTGQEHSGISFYRTNNCIKSSQMSIVIVHDIYRNGIFITVRVCSSWHTVLRVSDGWFGLISS